ncbi:MAG: hypothetical protein ACYTEK_28815, partial [Planctomycetota bacterium]
MALPVTGGRLQDKFRRASGRLLYTICSIDEERSLSETQAAFFVCVLGDLGIKTAVKGGNMDDYRQIILNASPGEIVP